jgi:uncharacterized protein (DUF488 family)
LGTLRLAKRYETVSSEPLFTIGHSTRSIPEFVDLLRQGPARVVVDVRTMPRSRRNPQYNEAVLEAELAPYQIGYVRIAGLGGLRGRSPGVAAEINALWRNQSFHNYADYALSEAFETALHDLLGLSLGTSCAIMCAEAVWWRCHRRIIADYLLIRGRTVFHLMGAKRCEAAKLTPGAVPCDGLITYPV